MNNTTRRLGLAVAVLGLMVGLAGQARAGMVFDSVNADQPTGTTYWAANNIGWFYSPAMDYVLNEVDTKFGSNADGRNQTVTEQIFDLGPPMDGGTLLRTTTFVAKGTTFAGGSFADLQLLAGHTYFIAFENVAGLDVNITDEPATWLSLIRYDLNPTPTFEMIEGKDHTNYPRLVFKGPSPVAAVPEPSTIALACSAVPVGLGLAWKRRRKAVTA
jgi:hypothetical protein